MTRSARGTVAAPGKNVRQKAGLNRAILASGWGLFARRLEDKAKGRVEKIKPAYTSQTCSACGTRDGEARESQARLPLPVLRTRRERRRERGQEHRGRTGRDCAGRPRVAGPVNREPQAA